MLSNSLNTMGVKTMWNVIIPALCIAANYIPNLLFKGFYPEATLTIEE